MKDYYDVNNLLEAKKDLAKLKEIEYSVKVMKDLNSLAQDLESRVEDCKITKEEAQEIYKSSLEYMKFLNL